MLFIHVACLWMCVLLYFRVSCVCLHVCTCPLSPRSIAGVRPGRALLGFPICTPPVCVPAVCTGLSVWRNTKKKMVGRGDWVLSSDLDGKNPPPREIVLCWMVFKPRKCRKRTPPEEQFWGLFLSRGPLRPGSSFGNHPKMKPPRWENFLRFLSFLDGEFST